MESLSENVCLRFTCVVLGAAAHVPQGLPYEATFGPFGPNTPPPTVATDTEVLLCHRTLDGCNGYTFWTLDEVVAL